MGSKKRETERSADSLVALRAELDGVDARIVDSLAERVDIVRRVAALKHDQNTVFRDPERERSLVAKLTARARSRGIAGYFIGRIYREIIDHSIRLQQILVAPDAAPPSEDQGALVVGFQGAEGSYGYLAGTRHFSAVETPVEFRGFETFANVLAAVESGAVDVGLLPLENTTAGSINQVYDLLHHMDLSLVGEEVQPVEHCLLGLPGTSVNDLKRVFSQAPALAQCSHFLGTLDGCCLESFTDTAMSVERVAHDGDPGQAAIASELAGRIHGLEVLRRDIANQRENHTRFVAVSRDPVDYDLRIACKTSLLLATRDEEGALLSCLSVFADHHLNLTKLESRPRPNMPWEYLFYIDFEGNVRDPAVQVALDALGRKARFLKVFGSYPARATPGSRPASATGSDPAHVAQRLPIHKRVRVGSVLFGGDQPTLLAMTTNTDDAEGLQRAAHAARESGASLLVAGHPPGFGDDEVQAWFDAHETASRSVGLPWVARVARPHHVNWALSRASMVILDAMHPLDTALLQAVGRVDCPVLLARPGGIDVAQWLKTASSIIAGGNQEVVLWESGSEDADDWSDMRGVDALLSQVPFPIVVALQSTISEAQGLVDQANAALQVGVNGVAVAFDGGAALDAASERTVLDLRSLFTGV